MMFSFIFAQLFFHITLVSCDSKSAQSRQYANNFQQPIQPIYGSEQKWFYSSNQQPMGFSWYWTNNDVPSSNFFKNTLPSDQADQLSNWACGRTQMSPRFSRIMGGQDAVPHSYPWMVSLAKRSLNNLHLCGGVLLTRRHILTAAHCMEDFKDIKDMNVYVGLHYVTEKKNPIGVLSVDIHPQYNADTFANDVAVITLMTTLPENDPRIGTICLPPDETFGKNLADLKPSGIAIGWGSTSFGGRPSNTLKQVVLPILDTIKWPCNLYVTYAQGQLCAGELAGGVDTCQADSGGPLMMENNEGRWEVVGITSFGKSCGKPDTPGVYTRVSTYNNFIRSSIRLSRQANFYYSSARQYSLKDLFIVNIMAIVFLLL